MMKTAYKIQKSTFVAFASLGLALVFTLGGVLVKNTPASGVSGPGGLVEIPASAVEHALDAIPWAIRPVDVGVNFTDMTDRSLALDSGNNSHIAYGQGHLYHSYYNGSWQFETVDANYGVGRYAAIAIDSTDHPHFSYYDSVNKNLLYARKEGINNYITSFPSPADDGAYTSLGLDASDYPHISYYDITNGDLKYARWDGATWITTTIDSTGDVGRYTSLAIDTNNYPSIAYYDVTNADLKIARWGGTDWNINTVDSTGDVGSFASLALNSSDEPYISYYDAVNQDLKLAHWIGVDWSVETVISAGEVGQYTSLAFDKYDYPNISYYNATGDLLNFSYWTYSGWKTDTHTLDGCKFSSLAIDNAGLAGDNGFSHISCSTSTSLWHTLEVGWQVWSNDQLDVKRTTGRHSDLALDAAGATHISYNDSNYGNLFYAKVTATSQTLEYIDYLDGTGTFSSIALDSTGNPHVSYLDETNDRLKYAHYVGSDWVQTTVDPSTYASGNTSIALDDSNRPRIAYQSVSNVMYAAWNGTTWDITTVAAGSKPSLALGAADNPTIAYYSSAGLNFAHLQGTTWLTETVDAGESGLYTSLALDDSGYAHISYGFGPLKYAYQTAGGWVIQTVDSSLDAGFYHSLALNQNGDPQISYSSYQSTVAPCDIYHLEYARWSDDAWILETVDSDGGVGQYNALALDSAGNPHISYYDCVNGNLKYAVGSLQPGLAFGSAAYAVGESAGVATVTVTLSSVSQQTVTVKYVSSNGTAIAGKDYIAVSGSLSFAPGVISQTFNVPILEDSLDETDETVTLTLSNPVNAGFSGDNPATLTIGDNDPPPTLSFSSQTISATESAATAQIQVNLSAASSFPVTIDYQTADGTATAGEDYTAVSGVLTFAPGVTTQTFSVTILPDGQVEGAETVYLHLANPSNASLGSTPATLLITEEFRLCLPVIYRQAP